MASEGRRRFEDKVCVVTGGGSGIGAATARALAQEGGRVAVLELDEDAARRVAEECGEGARGYACDVSDSGAVGTAFADLAGDLGPVEVLVNSAGVAFRRQEVQERVLANFERAVSGGARESVRATSTLDDETWDRTIRVHLYGTFYCCREALRVMEERERGVICNLSSVYGVWGAEAVPEYGAAKGGVTSLTKGMAQEVAGAGIRVNAIAPGYVETPMTAQGFDERIAKLLLAQVPLGGFTTPETIAALALHLCSDEASYTTGQVVSPNGGIYT